MKYIWLPFLIWVALSQLTWAEELSGSKEESVQITSNSGLRDYLAYAVRNNAGLKAAYSRWQESLERIPQETSLDDPMLSLDTVKVQNEAAPQEYRLGVSQRFPWFGKRKLRGDAAAEESNAVHQEVDGQRLVLFNRIKQAYYEYYYLHEAIQIMEENQNLLTYFEEIARTKFIVGQVPQQNVLKAQVEIDKLANELISLRYMREAMAAELNAAMNRPPEAYLPPPRPPDKIKFELTDAEVLAMVRDRNPELKALGYMAAMEGQRLKLAEREYYPDFDLGLTYIRTDMFEKDMRNQVMAGVSVNIPLQLERRQAAEEEAWLGQQRTLQQRYEKENELLARLKLLLSQFRDAERRINLYHESLIPKAQQTIQATQSAYITGNKADFLDLLDDQRTLLEFTLANLRAVSDYEQRLAEMEMLIGQPPAELELPRYEIRGMRYAPSP